MSVYKKLRGIIGNLFTLGIDTTNHSIKDHTDGVELTNYDGTVRANAVVARPQGVNADIHAATYLDVKERVVDLQFYFDGASAPAPGANTGTYGICHTSGGGFSAGQIYFDDGVALLAVPMYQGICCSPRAAFTGTVSMIADGLYLAETAATPFNWTLKGDGTPIYTGLVRAIEVPFGFADFGVGTKSSTTSIPENARIIRSLVKVTTAFTPGANPTVLVEVNGAATDTTIQTITDNNVKRVAQYDVVDDIPVPAGEGGPVRLTMLPAVGVLAGVGTCIVEYVVPFA